MDKNLFISSFKRILKNPVVWVLVIICGLEVSLRNFWRPWIVGSEVFAKYSPIYDYGYDFWDIYFLRPDNHIETYKRQYRTIKHDRFLAAKEPNEFRIFVFGSSVSYGEYVPPEEAYPNFLESSLQELCPSQKWVVINWSSIGSGSLRHLLSLEKVVHLQPDLIILDPHGSNEYEDYRDLHFKNIINQGVNGILVQSWLVVLAKKMLFDLFNIEEVADPKYPKESVANEISGNREKWTEAMIKNIQKAIQIAKGVDARSIVVGRAHIEFKETAFPNNVLSEFQGYENAIYFDKQTELDPSRFDLYSQYFYKDGNHLSTLGNQKTGGNLARVILENIKTCK